MLRLFATIFFNVEVRAGVQIASKLTWLLSGRILASYTLDIVVVDHVTNV